MFESWAHLYDDVYAARGKDYRAEADYIRQVISSVTGTSSVTGASSVAGTSSVAGASSVAGTSSASRPRLLDVACGTGPHLRHLAEHFDVQGLDRSAAMLRVAREHLPASPLHLADMTDFRIGESFDAVTCLFSSVGYLDGPEDLGRAVSSMASHVAEGGCLLVEPPVSRDRVRPPSVSEDRFESAGQEWYRRTSATLDGPRLRIRFVYQALNGQGKVNGSSGSGFVDEQPIYLFTDDEVREAFVQAGLEWQWSPEGPSGLGLHIGTRRGPRPE